MQLLLTALVQLPVWSDYLCVRIISSVCFEIYIDDVLYNQ